MKGMAVRLDKRPTAVVKAYWQEVIGLEEDAELLVPLVIEAVL